MWHPYALVAVLLKWYHLLGTKVLLLRVKVELRMLDLDENIRDLRAFGALKMSVFWDSSL